MVPRAPIDDHVTSSVAELLQTLTSTDRTMRSELQRAWKSLSRPAEDVSGRVRLLEQMAEKARQRIRRLALLFADGDIDRLGYDEGRAEAQQDLEAVSSELDRLGHMQTPATDLPSLDEVLRSAGTWRDILETGDMHLRREVLGTLIDHVIAYRVGWRKYETEIVWTPLGEHLRALYSAATRPSTAA